jgi:hypothetical protein
MRTEELPSLWNFGDTEPWRRGRTALIIFAVLIAISQLLNVAFVILIDDLGTLLRFAVVALIFWLQFYLIWIGWNWIRWLNALVLAGLGLVQFIWGMRDYSGFHLVLGAYFLGAGIYLGMAPSIYAFARHQRESIRISEIILMAAAFFLLLCTLAAASLGFHELKLSLEADAFDFARVTFDRVFQDHDVAFLAKHASAMRKNSSPPKFMRQMQQDLGNLEGVDRPLGKFSWKISRRNVRLIGEVRWETHFSNAGRVLIHLNLSGGLHGWEIDHLGYY